jgi:hypothetical protein
LEFNCFFNLTDSSLKAYGGAKTDTRKQPRSEEKIEKEPQLRILSEAGVLFSAA